MPIRSALRAFGPKGRDKFLSPFSQTAQVPYGVSRLGFAKSFFLRGSAFQNIQQPTSNNQHPMAK
jgi:hypothetical protein